MSASPHAARALGLTLVVAGVGVGPRAQAPASSYDVIIRHGMVFDGTGRAGVRADVAVANGHVVRLGDLSSARATTEIDAAGLYVAPGFINIHSHAVPDALPRAENMLTQGVTTEILNPDGGGALDISQQLAGDAARGLAVNIGAYIGFNSVWADVVGLVERRPTADEIDRMRALVAAGLDHGAWGVSAGLDYKPAYFARTDEVVRIVGAASTYRTNFTNHDRVTPESHFSSRVGIAETIAIGERTNLVPVVTHIKAQGHEQGTAPALVAMMRRATTSGHYTAADAYPYLAGQSGLGALIVPAWAQDGGREAMLARFKDPQMRARIVKEAEEAMTARFGGAQGVYLPATRQELVDVMRDMHVSAGEAVVRLLEQSNMGAILRFGVESDLRTLLKYPATSIACDCGATTETRTHPRMYGTFPRVLGHYVREQRVLTWPDAIRKMTGLPASTIGLVDRGFIAAGMAADVTIFDPATVIDRATYEDPAQLSEGIRFVLVNGRVAVADGRVTGAQGGRVLSRTLHMPSRPMPTDSARRLIARATISGESIAIALTQAATARRATGRVVLADQSGSLEAIELGIIQTAPRWASVTGIARDRATGVERAFTATLERADLSAAGHRRTLIVDVDGLPPLTAVLQ